MKVPLGFCWSTVSTLGQGALEVTGGNAERTCWVMDALPEPFPFACARR